MKRTLQQICADGREGYMHGLTSDAAIRTYRAKNRGMTYRKTENKDAAKIKAENFDHVNSLAGRFKDVEKSIRVYSRTLCTSGTWMKLMWTANSEPV